MGRTGNAVAGRTAMDSAQRTMASSWSMLFVPRAADQVSHDDGHGYAAAVVRDRLQKLAALCLENARALLAAFEYCQQNGIGCFRVNSQILPIKTHPAAGYRIEELPGSQEIVAEFRALRRFCPQARSADLFSP